MKQFFLMATLAFGIAFSSGIASGHHGWSWTTGENIELTGEHPLRPKHQSVIEGRPFFLRRIEL